MYRLNLIPRTSRYILSNIGFTATNASRNIRIYRSEVCTKLPTRFGTMARYRYYDRDRSQETRRFDLFAVSLPTLIFSFFLGNEEDEEEVPEVIMTIKRAILLIQKGEFNKAEQMLHVALHQAQTIQHYDSITYVYDVMANLAFDTGDYKKAETLFVTVLQRLMSNGALENDMRVIHISLKMAKLFEHLNEMKKAELGYKYCIENLQSHIKEDSKNKDAILLQGMTFDWYAQMLLSQSRQTEAFKYFLQAYDISKKMNGEEHEQTVILLNDLGTVSYMRGDYDEAINYFSTAATIGENLPDMVDLGSIHINLGNVFLKKGLYDKAKRSCQKGRKIAKSRDDNDSVLEADKCLEEVKRLLSA